MTEEEINALPMSELVDLYYENLHVISQSLGTIRMQVRRKPLLGGCFGHGGFVMLSHWWIQGGLDHVAYYVAENTSTFVISRGDSKEEALQGARQFITKATTTLRLHAECERHRQYTEDAVKARMRDQEAARDQRREEARARAGEVVKSMPKRRKRIFDESEGKCHYCSTPLTLDGKWHIEHKMPKALMGGNEPGNLVASCVTCNHRKKDKTDVEFKAQLVRESLSPSPAKESEKV